MTENIQTNHLQIQNQELTIDAYLAEPTAEDQFPGIVVLQEIFGVNAHIRDVTERLAREGYVAIAPALYQRLEPGFETGYTPDAVKLGREYKTQTNADELLSDIQAAINHLKQRPNVVPEAIGCIGFCFGGHVAYLAATLPDIRATASFYGAGITDWCPGHGAPTLTRTDQINGTLYAFFGMDDASIPPDQVDAIEQELTRHQIPHRIFRYPDAEHGFFCDQRASYNPTAAKAAWQTVQELFEQTLKQTT
jgi:carboxymethylenebutenolidase